MPAGRTARRAVQIANTDRKDIMKKEQLGKLIIASEDTLYHVAKTLLYNDADCADAIQEAIVKAFTNLHTLRMHFLCQ